LGKKLVGIAQDNDKVTAKVASVEGNREELIECNYLVAADGAKGMTASSLIIRC
jgi:2-polyprenyl-6-methoxyphenol hydroxylase-like FAD-dependent oxidoreductase